MKQYTDREMTIAKLALRYYNLQAGMAYRMGRLENPDSNGNVILRGMEAVNFDMGVAREHIKNYIMEEKENDSKCNPSIKDCFMALSKNPAKKEAEIVEQPVPTSAPVQQASAPSVGAAVGALDILSQTITALLAQAKVPEIEAQIMGGVEQKVRDFIKSEYGSIERKVVTVVDGKKVPMKGIQHDKFETVLKFVANDEPVFLTGPAGSGKNVLCKQVAEALGLKFYFTNAVTQEYKLTGFTDAMGNYQPTQFYKAFTEGGVFMLDEMDVSIPEVLVILNAAIANRYFDFPAPIGYVEAHPDFRVIAAGNTVGTGADYQYVGRNQLDAASLDRFAVVKVDYSEAIENSVACGDIELAQFCREFRKSAQNAGQQVIVSYRAIERLAKMLQILSVEEALETCLIKGIEKDDLNIIVSGIGDSKYREALKKIVSKDVKRVRKEATK